MGLSFCGFWLKKDETMSDYWNLSRAEREERELFYVDKSWELVRFLRCPTEGKCEGELTLERWTELMEALSQFGDTLEDIWDAYYLWEEKMDAYDYNLMNFGKVYPKEARLIKTYETWYEETFNEDLCSEYYFSVGYMLVFWRACDKVLKYLEDPEYKVWMYAFF
jgi:hypothetical protein